MNEPSLGNQTTASGAPHPPDTDARSMGERETTRAEAQRKRYRAGAGRTHRPRAPNLHAMHP